MKIIVPMAGRGSRLRPHTLTVPKPLIPIAGKPIVQRLVEDIAKVAGEKIDEIAFIIGDFGPEVEQSLIEIAEKLGAKGSVYTQDEPLGTVDADYRGEIRVILVNLSAEEFTINDGDRIAQMVIAKHETAIWEEVDTLEETERGEGGFGSSGVAKK